MRCNCGVDPKLLTDQWLIAEQVELLMIPGMLERFGWKINNPIPEHFVLGKGHMTFWFNKLDYLSRRHDEVKKEVNRRGFKVTCRYIAVPSVVWDSCVKYNPSMSDSLKLRSRLTDKIAAKPDIWRYNRKLLSSRESSDLIHNIIMSDLFYV